VWAVAVMLLGGVSLFALLWCLPQGVALVVGAFAPELRERLGGVVADWHPAALVVLGIGLFVLGTAGQALLVAALRLLAVPCLGPTSGDRLAIAEEQRRR